MNELAAAKGEVAHVAFRINPNVGAHTHANITTGLAENKFGITMDDILVHDAKCEDNTLQLKLALMGDGDGFPVALGVIRDVDAPTYNDAVEAQIEEVKAQKK